MPDSDEFFINRSKLPPTGNIVLHFDSHPNLVLPVDGNWVLKEAINGFISTLVWFKPPWSKLIEDGSYTLQIGLDSSEEIAICSDLPIFVSTCTYKSLDKLKNPKEINFEVITLGKFLINEKEEHDIETIIEKLKPKFPENGRCFLSIDLDFFSTVNPFKKIYDKIELYDQLIELYWFGVKSNMDSKEREENVKTRFEQLSDLKNLWKHISDNGLTVEPSLRFMDLWTELKPIAQKLLAEYPQIDWELIHKAGCSYDFEGEPLISHITPRTDIVKLMNNVFLKVLDALPQRPAAFTIPMLDNNYCPDEDKEFIYQEVVETIKSKYGIQISEHYL